MRATDDDSAVFLGCCVVEITDDDIEVARERIARLWPGRENNEDAVRSGAALYVSYRDGCNLGGEVVVIPVPDDVWTQMEATGVKPSRTLTPELLARWAQREDVVDNEEAP